MIKHLIKSVLFAPFSQRERGVLAVEGAITFPVLILLLFGTVDIGLLAERYFALSRVAYEGARVGASLGGLSSAKYNRKCPTSYSTTSPGYTCSPTVPTIHVELQNKILSLLESNGFTDTTRIDFSTEHVSEVDADMTSNIIRIQITAPIPLITAIFGDSMSISVTSSAPYLYRS